MRLFLDEDSCSTLLATLLRADGHDVTTCIELNSEGASDVVQFTQSNRDDRVILTRNHHDYEDLTTSSTQFAADTRAFSSYSAKTTNVAT